MKQHQIQLSTDFRSEAHDYVYSKTSENQSCLIIAMPGNGISSFLTSVKYRNNDIKLPTVLIDLNELTEMNTSNILKRINGDLAKISGFEKTSDIFDTVHHIAESSSRYVVLIDRFEEAVENAESNLFNNLRAIAVKSNRSISFVFATTQDLENIRPLSELDQLYTLISSNIYYLKPLVISDQQFFIDELANTMNVSLTKDNIESISRISGGHTRIIKTYLDYIKNQKDNPIDDALLAKGLKEPAITYLFERIINHLSSNKQDVLKSVVLNPSSYDPLSNEAEYLKKIGVLTNNNKIFSEGLATYIKTQSGLFTKGLIFSDKTNEIFKNGDRIDNQLSANEYKFITYLHNHKNEVVEREDIVENVWGSSLDEGVSDEAVDQLVSRLREKIEEDKKNPQYLFTVRGRGFQLKMD